MRGGFPELAARPRADLNCLRLLAARAGQLISLTAISRDLGAAINTVKAWLSVLEASYFVVHPGDVRLPRGQDVTALPFSQL